jgi:hypothetical protein
LFSNYLHLHAYEAVLRTRKQKWGVDSVATA